MKNVIKVLLIGFVSMVSAIASASTLTVIGDFESTGTAPVGSVILTSVMAGGVADGIFTDTITSGIGAGGSSVDLSSFSEVTNFFTIDGWQLDLTSINVIANESAGALDFDGAGLMTLSGGGTASPVNWSFTSSEFSGAISYNMSITAVPVPAAVWLFGSGLIGLIGMVRRKA